MKDYERTCYTAQPDPNRGPRTAPEFSVMAVEQCGSDQYDVWIRSGETREWWLAFNDWLLSYITAPTWVGHHSYHTCSFMVSGRDAVLFKLMQKGLEIG